MGHIFQIVLLPKLYVCGFWKRISIFQGTQVLLRPSTENPVPISLGGGETAPHAVFPRGVPPPSDGVRGVGRREQNLGSLVGTPHLPIV